MSSASGWLLKRIILDNFNFLGWRRGLGGWGGSGGVGGEFCFRKNISDI